MAHDIFISYSTKDKLSADVLCTKLEQAGIACWVAPRDILPGKTWAEAIVDAIDTCQVFVVIISENSNSSPQVLREIERAVNANIPVLPLRIQEVQLSKSLSYYLSSVHWLDAIGKIDKYIPRVAENIRQLMGKTGVEAAPIPEPAKEPPLKLAPPVEVEKEAPALPVVEIPQAAPVPESPVASSIPASPRVVKPAVVKKPLSRKWLAGLGAAVGVLMLVIVVLLAVNRALSVPAASQSPTFEPTVPAIQVPFSTNTVNPSGQVPQATVTMLGGSAKLKVCLATDISGVNGNQLNQDAWTAINRAIESGEITGRVSEPVNSSDYVNILKSLVNDQCDLVVSIGVEMLDATVDVAKQYPDRNFAIVDAVPDPSLPNLMGSTFDMQQAAYLAGYLAAGVTKTGKVGTLSGVQVPPATSQMDGFSYGVQQFNQVHGTSVILLGWDVATQTGLFTGDFTDKQKCYDKTRYLLDQGADVVFAVFGQAGYCALPAIKDKGGLWMIGTDRDWSEDFQNKPDELRFILASTIKRVDKFLFGGPIDFIRRGDHPSGEWSGNLSSDGVSLVLSSTPLDMQDGFQNLWAKVSQLKDSIASGQVTIPSAPNPAPTQSSSGIAPPACTQIGQKWTSPVDNMTLVCVPAGEFTMGAGQNQENSEPFEMPVHTVNLDAFWIDQTEVTNGMYAGCVASGKCKQPVTFSSNSRLKYYDEPQFANYPVIFLIWFKAQAYCAWAGRHLPSEAQWEKAARGTDGHTYPWGESIDCWKANYGECKGDTTPVDNYPDGASPYGALDMAGNVLEWVADWYGEKYYSASPLKNPPGPDTGTLRSIRGGGWNEPTDRIRTFHRDFDNPNSGADNLGFRCAFGP